ncbi:MAG: hypothetical protein AABX40_07775, partial [Candidatus Hydrothermarchaeota archaeon]
LGSRYMPRDVELARDSGDVNSEEDAWKREKERVLSFIYSIIGSALVLTVIVGISLLMFSNRPYQLGIEAAPMQAAIAGSAFLLMPLLTSIIGEFFLFLLNVPDCLKR